MKPSPSKTPKAKAAKQPNPKRETAPKEPKTKKEKTPREPQVVFAFRLTKAQRDQIHKAAGPGKATRFVLSAALAASGDREALQSLAIEAQSRLK